MENFQEEVENKPKKQRKKKVDPFMEMTDKIITKKGMNPKDFDKNAIFEARKKLKEEFVNENISLLLD